jgi:hypothetical protein
MHNVNWQIISIHLNNNPAWPNFKPMSIHSPHGITARPAHTAARVVVAVIAGPDTPPVAAPADVRRWRALTPLALWSTLSVRDASLGAMSFQKFAGLNGRPRQLRRSS